MLVDQEEARKTQKAGQSKKADDLYPVVKQSQTRKRGYSDVD